MLLGMVVCKRGVLGVEVYGGGGVWISAVSDGIGVGGLTGSCIINVYRGFGVMTCPWFGGPSATCGVLRCFVSVDGAQAFV